MNRVIDPRYCGYIQNQSSFLLKEKVLWSFCLMFSLETLYLWLNVFKAVDEIDCVEILLSFTPQQLWFENEWGWEVTPGISNFLKENEKHVHPVFMQQSAFWICERSAMERYRNVHCSNCSKCKEPFFLSFSYLDSAYCSLHNSRDFEM